MAKTFDMKNALLGLLSDAQLKLEHGEVPFAVMEWLVRRMESMRRQQETILKYNRRSTKKVYLRKVGEVEDDE